MTLQELRDLVRNLLETDTTELPDGVLDLFLQDAYERIVYSEKRWPGFEQRGTVVTEEGTRAYAFPDDASGNAWVDVAHMADSTWFGPLEYISNEHAEDFWSGVSDINARPRYWSIWEEQIQLWPKPDGIYTLNLRGFRGPSDWIALGAGQQPDLPRAFDIAIAYMATSLAYAQIEDVEMAAHYQGLAVEKVGIGKRYIFDSRQHRPIKLNGGSLIFPSYSGWVQASARATFL
jgi:hypothetical protein